ncbi:MAG: NAD(P)-dependent alcohol dehydrogenase [Sphingobacteriales bacterium]|jgi:alcohol dehydrogenase (NADP+)|nr:NAD(P)-dependent alcohol dehydrogenase [Sphingobacteriales bacterium]
MPTVHAYATPAADALLAPLDIERREVGENDIQIEILYCGVCHSDIHQARNEWGNSMYPMVPGHEIVGRVTAVGSAVTSFKIGELAGVGCIVDSCRTCSQCEAGEEQFCENGMTGTYNSKDKEGHLTYGGYSTHVVVDEKYTLHVSEKLDIKGVAPLLCAGITTYSPLRHWKVSKGQKVAIVGLGGLGHMGVKLAAAMGAEVTVISTSDNKAADAKRLGATHFINSKDLAQMATITNTFHFILNTVSAPHSYDSLLPLLRTDGAMVLVGAPPMPSQVTGFNLIMQRKTLAGSLIGGIRETQEMLDFCAEHSITSDVEMIHINQINEAYERILKSDVKYRFVIDIASLKA